MSDSLINTLQEFLSKQDINSLEEEIKILLGSII